MTRLVALFGLGLLAVGLCAIDWRVGCAVVGFLVWVDSYIPDDEVKQ